jgi:hypothetical protein
MASEARAETLTLTVLSGTTTTYSTTGLMSKVTAEPGWVEKPGAPEKTATLWPSIADGVAMNRMRLRSVALIVLLVVNAEYAADTLDR